VYDNALEAIIFVAMLPDEHSIAWRCDPVFKHAVKMIAGHFTGIMTGDTNSGLNYHPLCYPADSEGPQEEWTTKNASDIKTIVFRVHFRRLNEKRSGVVMIPLRCLISYSDNSPMARRYKVEWLFYEVQPCLDCVIKKAEISEDVGMTKIRARRRNAKRKRSLSSGGAAPLKDLPGPIITSLATEMPDTPWSLVRTTQGEEQYIELGPRTFTTDAINVGKLWNALANYREVTSYYVYHLSTGTATLRLYPIRCNLNAERCTGEKIISKIPRLSQD